MTTSVNTGPVILEPRRSFSMSELTDLWRYREVLFFLTWRDIKGRYQQPLLGAAWAILQPVLTMVVFSLIFGNFAKLPSDGIPYPIFTLTALLPWQLFSGALSNASNSLVGNQNLITKVYFPRLVVPISAVLATLVDFAISFLVLIGMMIYYQIPLTERMWTLPAYLLLAMATALGVSLWLSAMNVQYRDVRYAIPFLVQFWMYATPVAYSISIIPENLRAIYSAINPMTGVVEGFRWALLGTTSMDINLVLFSAAVVGVILISGILYFRRMEDSFADII